MCYSSDPDFEDHDPHKIVSHIKVQFHDVLGEPSQTQSCKCIWDGAECCYTFMFDICYGLPVGLCHLWITMFWGLQFGSLLFWHVWCLQPLAQWLGYLVHIPANCLRLCVRCVLDPCCEACSYVFMFCMDPPSDRDVEKAGGKRVELWHPMAFM